jgi:hypothetical protein
MNEYNFLDHNIGGPRTKLIKGRLGRDYYPYKVQKNGLRSNVLALHVDFSDSVKSLHQSYAGKSHALMTNWISYANFYGINIHLPFISENEQEYNTKHVMDYYLKQIPDSIQIVAWSKSSITLLNALGERKYSKFSSVNLISPWFIDNPTSRFVMIKNSIKNNEHISYSIWYGLEDTDVPTYLVQDWIKEFKKQSIDIVQHPIRYSTHWNYWIEPEPNIYSQISVKK